MVGRRVTWDKRKSQPSRGDFWACCPFHQEKTPSFHCDDGRQQYHCFGCGVTGDIFRFLTEREGLSFPEAVEQLAGEAGVPLPKPDPEAAKREQQRASLSDILETAAGYYEDQLKTPQGERARAYAEGRGFKPRSLHEFRFGFAPDARDPLRKHLTAQGVSDQEMANAGLITVPDDGRTPYDRMRGRLIIPIQDRMGRVIGFGGRTIDADREPKYLNSPETSLFQKRSMLFNLHRAREPAHRTGQIIVVEGYLDAIMVQQAGVEHVVAALGTAFTEDQIKLLWRLADEPVLCFDGDKAGRAAAYRAIDRMLPILVSGKSFRFVFLPEGTDPDDIVRAGGREAFLGQVQRSMALHDVLWARETEKATIDTPERRASLEKRVDELTAQISDPRVAKRYAMNYRIKLADLFRVADGRAPFTNASQAQKQAARAGIPVGIDAPQFTLHENRLERTLMGLSVEYPDLFEEYLERVMHLRLNTQALDRFRTAIGHIVRVDDVQQQDAPREAPVLNDDFHLTLHAVHGQSAQDGREGAEELRRLIPLLKLNPPDHVVRDLYVSVIDRLELRDMRQDYEQEIAETGDDLDEHAETRLIAFLRDIQRRGEEIARSEQSLAEAVRLLKKIAHADPST